MADSPEANPLKDPTKPENVVERCIHLVAQCNQFKQDRLARIALYRELYAGKAKKKYRQPFNVVLPTFSGAMDTLMAEFNDDLSVDLTEQEPADYLSVRKLNALWKMESGSVAPTAKFPLKTRQDRSNALFSGRGFMMNYAVSKPKYRNNFEVFELEDAIFQPNGGGHLELHNYAGRDNIVRSKSQLLTGDYDQAQVTKLLAKAAETDFDPQFSGEEKGQLSKFKAMGLAPERADYSGEQMFKLVEMGITIGGVRYYIVFSPWYKEWVRFGKLKDIFSAELWPWVSWATHEDNKNFLSKSYADDLYGIAEAVHTLFNQELTNREKKNYNARGYDKSMFPDVAKLDQAQYRPDALVPVTVPQGKRIEDGIFTFQTAELRGTIDLVGWIQGESNKNIGVSDLAMGSNTGASKRATVILAEQNALSKRILLRSSSYTEALSEIAKLFVQGAKDHLPAELALKRLGIEGEDWEPVIRRTDLDLYSDVDVRITSSSIEMRNSQMKKEARLKTLTAISADPLLAPLVNPRWRAEELLRSGGEYDDAELKIALDTKDYGNKEEVAYAHKGIQEILHNEKPDMFYGATTLFMKIIHDYAVNNRISLGMTKYQKLIQYEMAHAPVAQENMLREAGQAAPAADPAADPNAPPAPAPAPMAPGVPSATAQTRQVDELMA